MEPTWFGRDLPVLDAVVRLLDSGEPAAYVRDIAAGTGLEPEAVVRALDALDGEYVRDFTKFGTGGDPNPWRVEKVTAAARRAVGQWPTAENLANELAVAFGEAADDEQDPERKNRLRQLASFLGETGKDIAAEVIAKVILRPAGLG